MSETGISVTEHLLSAESVEGPADQPPNAKLSFFFLVLFTLTVYARPEDIFPAVGQLHLTLTLGICAGVTFLGALFSGNIFLVRSRELYFLLVLTLLFTAGIPFAYWRGGSFQLLTQIWLKTLLIFFLLTQTLVSLRRIRAILWAIVLSELAVSAYSVLNPSRSSWVGDRMSGVNQGILGWNFLGIAAALTIPYIAALFIDRPSFVKSCLLAATTFAMLWMLVLTASRSGVLTVMFSILVTAVMVLRDTVRGKAIGVLLVVALVAAICVAPGVFWNRMQTIWSDSSPTTNDAASAEMSEQGRSEVLIHSIQYTLQHPIFGLGLGNFEVVNGEEVGQASAWVGTHNSYTELSSEAGIPALLVFVALLFVTMGSMRRIGQTDFEGPEGAELSRMSRATFASLLSFMAGGLFAHIAYEYYLYYPIAIAAGVQYLASHARITPEADLRSVAQETWGIVPIKGA
jgi:O-antigen ligase